MVTQFVYNIIEFIDYVSKLIIGTGTRASSNKHFQIVLIDLILIPS